MISYKNIIDTIIHKQECEYCGKIVRIKIHKDKLPAEDTKQGQYVHEKRTKCPYCNEYFAYKVRIFYKIHKPAVGKSKIQVHRKKFITSWKHKCIVHCKMCINFENNVDCKTTWCPFYGTRMAHRTKQTDADFWWAVPPRYLKDMHDKFYIPKCKRVQKQELKESSTTQTTEESSKKSE